MEEVVTTPKRKPNVQKTLSVSAESTPLNPSHPGTHGQFQKTSPGYNKKTHNNSFDESKSPETEETMHGWISPVAKQETLVYIRDDKEGWIPAELMQIDGKRGIVRPRASPTVRPLENNNFANRLAFDGRDNDDSNHSINSTYENGDHDLEQVVINYGSIHNNNHVNNDILNFIYVDLSEYENQSLPLQDVDEEAKLITQEDMCDIAHLHEPSILYNLKERFEGEHGTPYTRAGNIVVSINPYRWIKGLYSEKNRHKYALQLVWKPHSFKERLAPHVYETSAKAFKGLTLDGNDQSILVSGESGAGKTVAVKILMAHLATFEDTKNKTWDSMLLSPKKSTSNTSGAGCGQFVTIGDFTRWVTDHIYSFMFGYHRLKSGVEYIPTEVDDEPEEMQQTNDIVQRVLDSNPLLEAFGNAKTSRNDNSSRFSKFIELQFHVQYSGNAAACASLAGSKCRTYLLEKSRIISHDNLGGERTFHIFYQLLAAPDSYKAKIWKGLIGSSPRSFHYVGDTKANVIEGLTDQQRFRITLATLKVIGINDDDVISLMQALCIILQLGNLVFSKHSSNDMASKISSKEELEKLSDIFGIASEDIERLFTTRKIIAGKDKISVPVPVGSAKDLCNSLSKELYSLMFEWLVGAINDAICAENNYNSEKTVKKFGVIGLLDIFGFEIKEVNCFEQLCINHTNERLQQKFTQDIFCSVRDEYKEEGINLSEVKFEDNSIVLNLVEGKLGLIDLLNEECLRTTGSDNAFVNKLYANHKSIASPLIKNKRYGKHEFGIKHYAGNVTYDARHFLEKNNDTLPKDIEEVVSSCKNELIRVELQRKYARTKERKGTLAGHTVWTKFKNQLSLLMTEIDKTKTWYVRCINPNKKKQAGVMDLKYAVSQLRCAGVVSAITIARSAFLNRLDFEKTLDRFSILSKKNRSKFNIFGFGSSSLSENVRLLLDDLLKSIEYVSNNGEVTRAFVCGKTRVYFRPGALEYLESERLKLFETSAVVIQSRVRRNIAVDKYSLLRAHHSESNLRIRQPRNIFNTVYRIFSFTAKFILLPSLSFFLLRKISEVPLWYNRRY